MKPTKAKSALKNHGRVEKDGGAVFINKPTQTDQVQKNIPSLLFHTKKQSSGKHNKAKRPDSNKARAQLRGRIFKECPLKELW